MFHARLYTCSVCALQTLSRLALIPGGGPAVGRWGVPSVPPAPATLALAGLVGRFVELSGRGASGLASLALRLVVEAQREGRQVAWVSLCPARMRRRATPFYAADAAANGIDLAALPVVLAADLLEAGRAASHLLRSGAFALVVLDLVALDEAEPTEGRPREVELPLPLQSRLTGLAQTHGAVLLALTTKPPDAASLGSLVSLHGHVRRTRARASSADGRALFELEVAVHKDKRNGPGWTHREVFVGPEGLT